MPKRSKSSRSSNAISAHSARPSPIDLPFCPIEIVKEISSWPASKHKYSIEEAFRECFSPNNTRELARSGKKNPNRERLGFCYWWRWGELNPRPKMLHARHYMLSAVFDLECRQHTVRSTPALTPAKFRSRLAGRRRNLSRDNDPTSTSTGTSGFGARP